MIELDKMVLMKPDNSDFLLECYKYNLSAFNRNSIGDFFQYSKYLSDFGSLVTCIKRCRIYRQIVRQYGYFRAKYHAVDDSGLSHGFIFGPVLSDHNKEKIFDFEQFGTYGSKDMFYGNSGACTNLYEA